MSEELQQGALREKELVAEIGQLKRSFEGLELDSCCYFLITGIIRIIITIIMSVMSMFHITYHSVSSSSSDP